jgi:hypothetical protein
MARPKDLLRASRKAASVQATRFPVRRVRSFGRRHSFTSGQRPERRLPQEVNSALVPDSLSLSHRGTEAQRHRDEAAPLFSACERFPQLARRCGAAGLTLGIGERGDAAPADGRWHNHDPENRIRPFRPALPSASRPCDAGRFPSAAPGRAFARGAGGGVTAGRARGRARERGGAPGCDRVRLDGPCPGRDPGRLVRLHLDGLEFELSHWIPPAEGVVGHADVRARVAGPPCARRMLHAPAHQQKQAATIAPDAEFRRSLCRRSSTAVSRGGAEDAENGGGGHRDWEPHPTVGLPLLPGYAGSSRCRTGSPPAPVQVGGGSARPGTSPSSSADASASHRGQ